MQTDQSQSNHSSWRIPPCNSVRLSYWIKGYLLTYLLTYLLIQRIRTQHINMPRRRRPTCYGAFMAVRRKNHCSHIFLSLRQLVHWGCCDHFKCWAERGNGTASPFALYVHPHSSIFLLCLVLLNCRHSTTTGPVERVCGSDLPLNQAGYDILRQKPTPSLRAPALKPQPLPLISTLRN